MPSELMMSNAELAEAIEQAKNLCGREVPDTPEMRMAREYLYALRDEQLRRAVALMPLPPPPRDEPEE